MGDQIYFSESDSDVDYDAAVDADQSSNSSVISEHIIGLELDITKLPTGTIGYLNPKTGWGKAATVVQSRKGKIAIQYFPAGAKAQVLPIEDLSPTSGALQPDPGAIPVPTLRGNGLERALLVAVEMNGGPADAKWGLYPLGPVHDVRFVHDILAAKGITVSSSLKTKLLEASDPADRKLTSLPDDARLALEAFGGYAYSSSTFAAITRQASKAPLKAKKAKPAVPEPAPPTARAATPTKEKRPREPELTYTVTVSGPLMKIRKMLEEAP